MSFSNTGMSTAEPDALPGEEKNFHGRLNQLELLAGLMLLAILAMLFWIGVWHKESYQKLGFAVAGQHREIAPLRGKVFSDDGVLLLWSRRCYDLCYIGAYPPEMSLRRELERFGLAILPGEEVLARDLTAAMLRELKELSARQRTITIRGRQIRHSRALLTPALCAELEQKYDRELSGAPGQLFVMLDRSRQWIKNSVKVERHPINGKDVHLPFKYAQLAGRNTLP
ncbi:MAG: hypothetical protein PHS41_04940 [Victivallaceae bacterium]|nr:hypothetical protein [Victivallaceae bacterium]